MRHNDLTAELKYFYWAVENSIHDSELKAF